MSYFDNLAKMATHNLLQTMGDTVTIDGVSGTAIVVPDSNMMLGGGVQLLDGAHLTVRLSDFPNLDVNAVVVHGDWTYILVELDSVDASGLIKGRMAVQ